MGTAQVPRPRLARLRGTASCGDDDSLQHQVIFPAELNSLDKANQIKVGQVLKGVRNRTMCGGLNR